MRNYPPALTRQESSWGLRYLLFQMIFLPSLLSLILPRQSSAHINTVYFTVNFLAVLFIFRKFLLENLRELPKKAVKVLLWALAGCLAYQILTHITSVLTLKLMPGFFNVNDAHITATAQTLFWPMAVGIAVFAPVAEELCYRALLMDLFSRRSPLLAYAVSILVFCAIHVSGYIGFYPWSLLGLCFLQYLPAGLVLTVTYRQSGSILCPIAIHMTVNIVGVLSMR